jgi:Mrp family chromosome partitioning ATPase
MNSGNSTEEQNEESAAGGLGLSDILFALFRYKLLLLASIALGGLVAAGIWLVRPPTYESTAKIYIPYVITLPRINPKDNATDITPTMMGADTALNTEIEMLRSFDTAIEVAERIGPEKVLAHYGGTSNLHAAAGVIASGIFVAPPRAMYLSVTLSHRDPELVQPLLEEILNAYMHRHGVLRLGDTSNYVAQAEVAAQKILKIDVQLKELRTSAGVPNIQERQRSIAREYEELRTQMLHAQTELARMRASVGQHNQKAMVEGMAEPLPAESITRYSEVLGFIDEAKQRRRRAMLTDELTTIHPVIQKIDVRIQKYLSEKLELEQQYPALTNYTETVPRRTASGTNAEPRMSLEAELAEIQRLARMLEADQAIVTNLTVEAFRLMELEPKVAELERLREAAEQDYAFFRTAIEKSQTGDKGTGAAVNMQKFESPTPPTRNRKKVVKMVGLGFVGCVGMGFAIAIVLELFLDRSIRRPSQIVRALRLPVMLTIPDTRRRPSTLFSWQRRGNLKVMRPDKYAEQANSLAAWNPDNHMQTQIEGLRERVITHFDARDINRKPKLVGLTSTTKGAGVSTLASGLAASLSRTENGSVLLVDWNADAGKTYSFYKGKAGYGPSESMEAATSESVEHADGKAGPLSLAKTGHQSKREDLRNMLPPDFDDYMPKLKAEAYDYIVFDMASVTPASTTPRMAGRMDLVLFVIESEKTKDYVARYACGLLRESRANVLVILNKFFNPVPEWLSQD